MGKREKLKGRKVLVFKTSLERGKRGNEAGNWTENNASSSVQYCHN